MIFHSESFYIYALQYVQYVSRFGMASRTSAALEIRKLRKKLRQIENLERKDGDLLDEELLKVFIIHRHNVETISYRHVQ